MADIIENGKGQYMDIVPYNVEMGSYNIDIESQPPMCYNENIARTLVNPYRAGI